ncbi:hypothetical protein SLA2020_071660 [Shorea laevis]
MQCTSDQCSIPCFGHPCCLKLQNYLPFIIFLLIGASHVVGAARELGLQEEYDVPRHLNFFRSAKRGRQRLLSCGGDPTVCLDRERNPWGGSTCCFGQICKDTMRDSNHCGTCGHACAYGLVCCDGKCVDVRNDSNNCGSCFQECPGKNQCSFAMCGYGE